MKEIDILKIEQGAKRFKYAFIISVSAVILSAIYLYSPSITRYNAEGKRIYQPGTPKNNSPLNLLFGISSRDGYSRHSRLKSDLKNFGTGTAAYFADGRFSVYPENPNDMELAVELFNSKHLRGTDKELPKNWKMPNTWKEVNESNSPFLFVRKTGEAFTGSSNKVIFITKDGYQFFRNMHLAVYEDAQVDTLTKEQAEKYWREASE